MPNSVKVLLVGDIIGKGARNAFISYIPTLKEKYNYDIISINAENTTHGKGLNSKHYQFYKKNGIDVMTMGNHVLDSKDIYDYIKKTDSLIVPANVNYGVDVFDRYKVKEIDFNGNKIKFINILDSNAGKENFDIIEPISYFKDVYQKDSSAIYIIDFHGEYTLRKALFGFYFDGKASAVYGTHTHVQTADEKILPQGTAFISDVGMCGSYYSVIGYDYKSCVEKVDNGTSTSISMLSPYVINALLVEIDLDTKKAINVIRINEKIN